ncbi:regulator of G-protein signaling 11 isoform X1 [Metopolophium dirhodum]|uniref:regulator of G-protein signaling 11 isoform X1 n=1 Tax=Metopolophium dirhodum TaxID=44670 RepID=UPI0029900FFE|nr:regulator of G-protein signaling 11 isoform X1 [Metopolophium dirhodum]
MDKSDRRRRPFAFDKMEGLVREMKDEETGVRVKSQKLFLTSIPSAFAGYNIIEWLMDRLTVDETEAVHIANMLCQYGYFFPVNDSKTLTLKDDSSLYRFQIPYYWPCSQKNPDNVEYAIYLSKRLLRNKQRHALEDYEMDSLNSLKKNLQNKWEFITMQAEEQVRLSKDRKKGEKIVTDSQERAFWRVHRPPPGCVSVMEQIPIKIGGSFSTKKKRSSEDLRREVELLRNCIGRTRVKTSVALDGLVSFGETYNEYDPLITGAQPSNPWVTDDPTFWTFNCPMVEAITEKRIKRWALSMEDLVSDATGLYEFTNYLRKEYSHENIRFWLAVNDLKRSCQSQILQRVREIYDEFLAPGAPCEINIDGKTMERTHKEMKVPSRFTFDGAAEHVYTLLLKKDCYPRFIRSEHYKNLLANGVQPSARRRFFGLVGGAANKKADCKDRIRSTAGCSSTQGTSSSSVLQANQSSSCSSAKRRGSDRSLTSSPHELPINSVKVSQSHSQSNLSDIPYRGDLPCTPSSPSSNQDNLSGCVEECGEPQLPATMADDVCPWDVADGGSGGDKNKRPLPASIAEERERRLSTSSSRKNSGGAAYDSAASADESQSDSVASRLRRSCGLGGGSSMDRRRGSSAACTPQQTIDRPSVSSAEDFDLGPSPESRSPEKQPSTSPHEPAGAASSLDDKSNRKKLLKSLSLARKQSVTPVINVSSVDRDNGCDRTAADAVDETAAATSTVAEGVTSTAVTGPGCGGGHPPETVACCSGAEAATATATAAASISDGNDVCPWEDEHNQDKGGRFLKVYETYGFL